MVSACSDLCRLLRPIAPHATVLLCGSSLTGIGDADSDVDLTILAPSGESEAVHELLAKTLRYNLAFSRSVLVSELIPNQVEVFYTLISFTPESWI